MINIKTFEKILRGLFRSIKLGLIIIVLLISGCSSKPGSYFLDLTKLILGEGDSLISLLEADLTELNEKNDVSLAKVINLLEDPNTKTTNLADALQIVEFIKEIEENLSGYKDLKSSTENYILAIEKQELEIDPNSIQTELLKKRKELSDQRHMAMQHFLEIRKDETKAVAAADDLKEFVSDVFVEKMSSSEKILPLEYSNNFLDMVKISNNSSFISAKFDISNLSTAQMQLLIANLAKLGKNIDFIFFAKASEDDIDINIDLITKISAIIKIIDQSIFDLENVKVATFKHKSTSVDNSRVDASPSLLIQLRQSN